MAGKRMEAVYDAIAVQFEARHGVMPSELRAAAGRFLQQAGAGARVLDLGCGTGRDMAWLETLDASVVGADLSMGMLARAKRRVGGLLVKMDMRTLGFQGDRFQGVWCNAALLHLPKAEALVVLAEIRRVLAPGGTLFLSVQEGMGEGWETGPYGGVERFFARYNQSEMETLLISCGFRVLERTSTGAGERRWLSFLARPDGNWGM